MEEGHVGDEADAVLSAQGAEAKVYLDTLLGQRVVVKERFSKGYRHPELDTKLTKQRMLAEVRAISRCKDAKVPTPMVLFVDIPASKIYLEYLTGAVTVKEFFYEHGTDVALHASLITRISQALVNMHAHNIVHGDLTTSNMMLRPHAQESERELILIDFGLSFVSTSAEDKAVDLYVLERALSSTHPQSEPLFDAILQAYAPDDNPAAVAVIKKLEEVRARGRKRSMLG
eukprot:m.46897 g.46897  ORF g.46897 m.46897 type:complete len:230 (-) comp6817_c0_seq1:136-825(-)